ncbi:hypothetical protein [Lacticaseibacillus suihuaensis]
MQLIQSVHVVYTYASDTDATDTFKRSFGNVNLDPRDASVTSYGEALAILNPGYHLADAVMTKVYQVTADVEAPTA